MKFLYYWNLFAESRSYSAGAVYPTSDPAFVFGSVVSDSGEYTEDNSDDNGDLNRSRRSSSLKSSIRLPKINPCAAEISLTPQGGPLSPAPGILVGQYKHRDSDQHMMLNNHECSALSDKVKVPSGSKSDGDICSGKTANNVFHSHSQNFRKQYHNQQCCGGFGGANRQRFHSNACTIV